MNAAKFNRLLIAQTATARKVFDCVPAGTSWGVPQIVAEMNRNGLNPGVSIVMGCLKSLREDGLVKELSGQRFTRAKPSQPATTVALDTQEIGMQSLDAQKPAVENGAKAAESSALSRMESLSARLRAVGQDLVSVAAEIDDCILELHQQNDGMLAKIEKAKQLKQLLKEF